MADPFLVRPDRRGRVSLRGLVRDEQYKATLDSAGRVLLEPAVVLTETELTLLNDDGFWRRVEKSRREPSTPLDLDAL